MGVKGLTTYIDSNPGLLKDHYLYNSRVIFDGNNLYHFLYKTYNIRILFNGDYPNYAKKIRQVFLNLQKCGIRPFVVFDGGYNTDDRKHRTCLERAKARLRHSGKMYIGRCSNLLPILCYETFRRELDALGVEHVTCDYEADEHIAILANRWNCPVISSDSDFYVYKIQAGFFPMDYVDFRVKRRDIKDPETGTKRPQMCLFVQKYHHDYYRDVLGKFNPKFVPLLATILGNDFVNEKIFSSFAARFAHTSFSKKKRKKRTTKAAAVVKWLQQQHGVKQAIQKMLSNFFDEGVKSHLEKIIHESIDSYVRVETVDSYLSNYVTTYTDSLPIVLNDFFQDTLPHWLMLGLLKGEISPFVQNAAVLRRVILHCQVEELKKGSSHGISREIRQVIYGILFGSRNESADETQSENKASRESHIEEFDRKANQLGKVYATAITEVEGFGPVLSLQGLPVVEINRRRQFILRVLKVSEDFVQRFDRSMQLLMAVTVYWARSACIPKYHLTSFLLTVLLLHLKRFLLNKEEEPEDELEAGKVFEDEMTECSRKGRNVDPKTSDVRLKEKAQATVSLLETEQKVQKLHPQSHFDPTDVSQLNLEQKVHQQSHFDLTGVLQSVHPETLKAIRRHLHVELSHLPQVSWKHDWTPRLSHCYAQLQSCILYSLTLNQLLLCPFENPYIPDSYDGSVLFLLSKTLETRPDKQVYVGEMLDGHLSLMRMLGAMVDAVGEEVGEGRFVEGSDRERRGRREEKEKEEARKRSRVAWSKMADQEEDEDDDEDEMDDEEEEDRRRSSSEEEEEEEEEEVIQIDIDVSNRFCLY